MKAAYWVDDQKTELTDGVTAFASAQSIGVSDKNIYVTGVELGVVDYISVYWKDTMASKTALSLGSYFMGQPLSPLCLDGEDFYIAATLISTSDGSDYIPAYWKNGTLQVLSAGTGVTAIATDITVK